MPKDVTETPVSSATPTFERETVCGACGTTVVAFYGLPHMWKFILVEDNDTKPLPFVNETICMRCMTDLIKFKAEVLGKR
jgi:hypothetical protein